MCVSSSAISLSKIIGGIEGSEPAHYPKPLLSVAAEEGKKNGGRTGEGARKRAQRGHRRCAVAGTEREKPDYTVGVAREQLQLGFPFSFGEFVIRGDTAPKAREGKT